MCVHMHIFVCTEYCAVVGNNELYVLSALPGSFGCFFLVLSFSSLLPKIMQMCLYCEIEQILIRN